MDDRTTEERIALWLETEAEGHLRDDVLTATFATTRSTRRRAHRSGWRTIPMPRSLPMLAVGAAAIVVVAVFAWNLLPVTPETGVVGPSATASPTASPTAAPSSIPTPLPRPSAIVDSTKALEVVEDFQRLMNDGRIEEAADLVWIGATISGRPMFSRGDVIAALQTTCGAMFGGPVAEVTANDVIRGTTLVDRPGYACPSAGYAYGARFTVENALIVEYWPRAQALRN